MAQRPGSCCANARSGTFAASAGAREVLNYRRIPNFLGSRCSTAMRRLRATCVFFILKSKPWWETSLCNGLAQQLKKCISALLYQTFQKLTVSRLSVHLSNAESYINIIIDFRQPFVKSKNGKSSGVQSNWKKMNPVNWYCEKTWRVVAAF